MCVRGLGSVSDGITEKGVKVVLIDGEKEQSDTNWISRLSVCSVMCICNMFSLGVLCLNLRKSSQDAKIAISVIPSRSTVP